MAVPFLYRESVLRQRLFPLTWIKRFPRRPDANNTTCRPLPPAAIRWQPTGPVTPVFPGSSGNVLG
jgi:hypothetical protein